MIRPPSIIAFERLYLGSILLSVVNAIVFWSVNRDAVVAMPQVEASASLAGLVGGMLVASLVVNVVISLLFWWLVARQASVAGKWLVVVTEVIGALIAVGPLLRLIQGNSSNVPGTILTLLSTALAVVAAAMLFRADAGGWFAAAEEKPVA